MHGEHAVTIYVDDGWQYGCGNPWTMEDGTAAEIVEVGDEYIIVAPLY